MDFSGVQFGDEIIGNLEEDVLSESQRQNDNNVLSSEIQTPNVSSISQQQQTPNLSTGFTSTQQQGQNLNLSGTNQIHQAQNVINPQFQAHTGNISLGVSRQQYPMQNIPGEIGITPVLQPQNLGYSTTQVTPGHDISLGVASPPYQAQNSSCSVTSPQLQGQNAPLNFTVPPPNPQFQGQNVPLNFTFPPPNPQPQGQNVPLNFTVPPPSLQPQGQNLPLSFTVPPPSLQPQEQNLPLSFTVPPPSLQPQGQNLPLSFTVPPPSAHLQGQNLPLSFTVPPPSAHLQGQNLPLSFTVPPPSPQIRYQNNNFNFSCPQFQSYNFGSGSPTPQQQPHNLSHGVSHPQYQAHTSNILVPVSLGVTRLQHQAYGSSSVQQSQSTPIQNLSFGDSSSQFPGQNIPVSFGLSSTPLRQYVPVSFDVPSPQQGHNLSSDVPIPQQEHNVSSDVPIPQQEHNLCSDVPIPQQGHNLSSDVPIPQQGHNLSLGVPSPQHQVQNLPVRKLNFDITSNKPVPTSSRLEHTPSKPLNIPNTSRTEHTPNRPENTISSPVLTPSRSEHASSSQYKEHEGLTEDKSYSGATSLQLQEDEISYGATAKISGYNEGTTFNEDSTVYADMFGNDGGEAFSTGGEFAHNAADQEFVGGGEFQQTHSVIIDGGSQFGVSSIHVDRKEELVWTGNGGGHLTSYLSTDLMKYTSFQVHPTEEMRDLQSIDAGILALSATTLNLRTRQGMASFTHESTNMQNMQCMVQLGGNFSHRLLLGGHQDTMIEYDLSRGEEIRYHQVGENGCVILRDHPRFVCHGDATGRIVLHDPRTMRQEHSFQSHNASLSDFDVFGNYVATCGFSNRMGQAVGDQFVMVFDLRMMKLSLPLRALCPPMLLRFVPGLTSCLAVVSPHGQWQLLDAGQPDNAMMSMTYQITPTTTPTVVHDNLIKTFDVSSSSQAIVFGDSAGAMYLFTTGSKPGFNNFPQETVMVDLQEQTLTMPMTDEYSSFATIPLYYPSTPLVSDWPEQYMKVKYRPTPPIDPAILSSMKIVGSIGYAPNIYNWKRNQVPYKFNRTKGPKSSTNDNQPGKNEEGIIVHVPWRYRKIELKYGKHGMDDFDYDQYNRTSFSGLEMSLPNSYCNPMLQMFYYIEPLRALMMSHLCEREFCLVCELGFLFHMLDVSMGQGIPCHASNFLRAFRTIPEASAMSLTLSDQDNRAKINFASKIQSWNRFVLQQLHSETLEEKVPVDPSMAIPENIDERMMQMLRMSTDTNSGDRNKEESEETSFIHNQDKLEHSPISRIFGSHVVSINKCTRCQNEIHKDTTSLLVNLTFPDLTEGTSCSFSSVVERSLSLEQTRQAWCDSCTRYQPIEQCRRYKTLPNILAMNCGLDSTQDVKFWKNQFELLLTEIRDKMKEEESKKKEEESKKNENKEAKRGTGNEKTTPSLSAGSPSTPSKRYPESSSAQPSPGRPCRYGQACTRHDCRFWHPGRDASDDNPVHILSLLDQTMEHSWIPLGMRATINPDGTVSLSDIPKAELETAKNSGSGMVYELVGVVSHIADPRFPDKNNLVACIKVGPRYHVRAKVSSVSHWYLFNDISIQPIPAEEAVWFPCGWKMPCVLYWQRTYPQPNYDSVEPINPITVDVFGEDKSLAQRGRKRITFTPLTADEMPGEGDLVAMDAEFVNLHQEEAEIRSDGTRTTIKPSHKSVARITCIRGQGPLEGTPFLDDYISTQEQVVDYLTQFSGIKPGDLDANFSQKHLTTLKSTYVKLRYLVDKGVKFVGHGLKNDFRVINMTVPPTQLIDTVHLFHMSHNRMVSLKFLAWHFLKLKIQSVTHDSIEDARTALALYQKYCELKGGGDLVMEVQNLYQAGKKAQWKVPGEEEDDQ